MDFLRNSLASWFLVSAAAWVCSGCAPVRDLSSLQAPNAPLDSIGDQPDPDGTPVPDPDGDPKTPTILQIPVVEEGDGIRNTIRVSPTESWSAIAAKIAGAKAGDEVVLAPGIYRAKSTVFLRQVGREDAKIVIRGEDPDQPPVWDGSGVSSRDCIQVEGQNYKIASLVFQGCQSGSAAGVRAVFARNLTVRGCEFRNNAQGVTGTAENFRIEFNYFHDNTNPDSHLGHNIYIYGGTALIRHNFLTASSSQNIHNRARDAVIEYNWLSNPGTYTGDIMTCNQLCGGTGNNPITQRLLLRGNVIEAGTPDNRSQMFALYYDEDNTDSTGRATRMEISFVYNTIVGISLTDGSTTSLVNMLNGSVATDLKVYNNAIHRVDRVATVERSSSSNWSIAGAVNWFTTGSNSLSLLRNLLGADPKLEDPSAGDFQPVATSPLLGASDPGAHPGVSAPSREFFREGYRKLQYRVRKGAADLGAFEGRMLKGP